MQFQDTNLGGGMMNYGLEEEEKIRDKSFDNDSSSDSDSDGHSTSDDDDSKDETRSNEQQQGGENTHESEDADTDDEADSSSEDAAKSGGKTWTTWDGGDYSEQESSGAEEESDWDHEHGTKFEIHSVADLFRLLNLNEHVAALKEEEVDLPALLLLKYEDLRSLGLDNDKTLRLLRVMNLVKLRRRSACHGSSNSSLFYGHTPGGASPLEKRNSLKPALSARLLNLNIAANGTTEVGQASAEETAGATSGQLKKLPLSRQVSDSSVGKHRSVRFSSLDSYDDSC